MDRTFNASEARKLVEKVKNLQENLEHAVSLEEEYKNDIKILSDHLLAEAKYHVLQDIPVEELNHDKRGFRIKALKEAGYLTLADVCAASQQRLTMINGIGETSACEMKSLASEMSAEATGNIKIKLSLDNKSDKASALVNAISRYRRNQNYINTCKMVLGKYRSILAQQAADLSYGTAGPIRWFFTNRSHKQKAVDAYEYLKNFLDGEIGTNCSVLIDSIHTISHSTPEEGWTDFSHNSIQFFTILEELNPGVLGTEDEMYGLPEDLAREIQDECFFPDGLLCDLRKYQELGVKYILHQKKVLLGDEMGLGKTVQAIAVMVSLKNVGCNHFMVICPASVITNWCREIEKMSKLRAVLIHGSNRLQALRDWNENGGVGVTTYETVSVLLSEPIPELSLLIVDEAHYIKNPEAARTIRVKTLSEKADRMLFMTGTALENKVSEMINLIRMLQPDIAGKINGMEAIAKAPRFREMVAPVYYRRKRDDVLTELPEMIESKEWCRLNAKEEEAYEYAVFSGNFAAARRVSWNVTDIQDSSKAKRLVEIVEEAESDGRKVIVFSFFLDTIHKVEEALGSRCMPVINGSVPPQRRQEIIDEFEQAPSGAVLPAQILAGGTGLNIQSASVVIFCEPQFKPSIENQAIARAYRMGQTRNVLVYRLLCEDTVDERIMDLLYDKQQIFDAFADQSVSADQDLKTIDDRTFGNIIQDEIDRISRKTSGGRAGH